MAETGPGEGSEEAARLGRLSRSYAEAIAAGDQAVAGDVIDQALAAGIDAVEIIGRILTPSMRRIGDLWEQNVIGIADEHLATSITETQLGRLYPALFRASPLSREMVLVSGVEGEHHLLGLRMVADILEGNGYEVLFLGADVHVSVLLAAIGEHRPAVVALGCTGPWATEALRDTLRQLGSHPGIPVILGGRGVPDELDAHGLTVVHVPDAQGVPAAVESVLRDARA